MFLGLLCFKTLGKIRSHVHSSCREPSSTTYSFSSAVFHFSCTTFCYHQLVELSSFIPLMVNFDLVFVSFLTGVQGFDFLGPLSP